ncbi:MAG TPA: peptidyl-prolyl cis-trans isomerase [Pyrinomonadaceae bacterium]
MRYLATAFILACGLMFVTLPAFGQESEVKVVDEVVAVVNDGVITLSGVKREIKDQVDSLVKEGKKPEEAQKMVDEKQGELIANLINEELLIQKAKEMGLEKDVEASLNARMLEIMKQQNFKTLDQLYEAMRKEGLEPDEIRDIWRKQAVRDEVVRRDVQAKVYWQATPSEVKAYYDTHKDKFTKAETVTLSDLFLNFAGRDPETVKAKANDLVKQARGGAEFTKLIMDNSDDQDIAKTKGSIGTFPVSQFDSQFPQFGKAIKPLKVGDVAEPIADDVGVHILHIDGRSAASTESQFDEDAVRRAILDEKFPEALKTYMAKLREDAYIKVNDTYRPIVSPLLRADERKEAVVKDTAQDQGSTRSGNGKSSKKPKNDKQK